MNDENHTLPEIFYVLKFYNESINFATLADVYSFMDRADVGFGEIYEMADGVLKSIHTDEIWIDKTSFVIPSRSRPTYKDKVTLTKKA